MIKEVDICMIVYNDVSHDSRVKREASTLVRQGYNVVVIAMIFGNTSSPLEEDLDGYKVIRVVARPPVVPYYTTLQRFVYLLFQTAYLLRKLKAKVYHAHDFSGLVPLALALLWNKPFVYDSHELFFDRSLKKSFFHWIRPLERFMAQRSKATITVNKSLSNILSEELDIPYPIVLRNCVDLRTISAKPAISYGMNKKIVIVHSGRIIYGRHLIELVSALQYLPEQFTLVLMGEGGLKSDVIKKANEIGVAERLKIIPSVPTNEVVTTLSQADLGVALITSKERSYNFSLPNKMFESIAAGLPIISSSNPELKELVDTYDIGLVCDPTDPQLIAQTIVEIFAIENYEKFRKNVQKARSELNWEHEETKLIDLYRTLIRKKPRETAAWTQI